MVQIWLFKLLPLLNLTFCRTSMLNSVGAAQCIQSLWKWMSMPSERFPPNIWPPVTGKCCRTSKKWMNFRSAWGKCVNKWISRKSGLAGEMEMHEKNWEWREIRIIENKEQRVHLMSRNTKDKISFSSQTLSVYKCTTDYTNTEVINLRKPKG